VLYRLSYGGIVIIIIGLGDQGLRSRYIGTGPGPIA